MHSFFGILYALIFLAYVSASGFIVYHFLRYSPTRIGATVGTTIFLTVFLVLIFTNAMIFLMLPLDTFFPGIDMPAFNLQNASSATFGPFSR